MAVGTFIDSDCRHPAHKNMPRYLHNRRSFSDFWEKQAARSASLGWTAVSQSSVDSKQMDQCYRACSRRARRELLSRYSLPTSCVPGFIKIDACLFAQCRRLQANRHAGCGTFFQKIYRQAPDVSTGFCRIHYVRRFFLSCI